MTEAPPARSVSALAAEPTRRVGGRWIALIALVNLGLYLGYIGPISVLLPNQVQAIAGSAHKVVVLGWVIANSGPQVLAPALAAPWSPRSVATRPCTCSWPRVPCSALPWSGGSVPSRDPAQPVISRFVRKHSGLSRCVTAGPPSPALSQPEPA